MSGYWRDRAACRGADPELWFPGGNDVDISGPVMVCESCPVRWECGEDALNVGDIYGIRAGFWMKRKSDREALSEALPHVDAVKPFADSVCADCGDPLKGNEKTKCRPCRRDLVPIEPVRERLRLLKQHRTYKQIAAESGLPLSSVLALRPKEGVSHTARTTAEAILSVPLPVGVS